MNRNKQSISLGGCAGGGRRGRHAPNIWTKTSRATSSSIRISYIFITTFCYGERIFEFKATSTSRAERALVLVSTSRAETVPRHRGPRANECKCSVSGHSKRAAIPDTAPLKEETARKKEMANEKAAAGRARCKAVCAECGFRILASACGE